MNCTLFFFLNFFWVSVYHSTAKQFSHWNWNTKRTIHNSVCTACVLMCGVFVSLFFLRIVIIQKVSTHEWTYTNTEIIDTNAHIHRWVRTNTHTHTPAHKISHRELVLRATNWACTFRIGRSVGWSVDVYWITTTTTTTKAGKYNGLRGRSVALL